MGRSFTPTRHVILNLTAEEAERLLPILEELTPDDVLRLLPGDADARNALAIGRVTKRLGQGANKLTIYEARNLTELLVALEGRANTSGILSRLGVELARQGGAKVGR